MKTTILGGIIFLVPIAMLAILLTKAYHIGIAVAGPIDKLIPFDAVAGIALVNILAILLILLLCFLCGVLARVAFVASKINSIDGLLIDMMPGYAVAKGVIGSVANQEEISALLTPVLVRFDDYSQIAFEIERNETEAVIFLPGAPSTWSGSTVMVDVARVSKIDAPTHKTVKTMRVLGRGSLQLVAGDAAKPDT